KCGRGDVQTLSPARRFLRFPARTTILTHPDREAALPAHSRKPLQNSPIQDDRDNRCRISQMADLVDETPSASTVACDGAQPVFPPTRPGRPDVLSGPAR